MSANSGLVCSVGLVAAMLLPLLAHAQWNYRPGDTVNGPAGWSTNYRQCSKPTQSPISIVQAPTDVTLKPLDLPPTLSYSASWANIDGNFILLDFADVTPVFYDYSTDTPYFFHGASFHSPSEHLLGGARYPMESQLMFRSVPRDANVSGSDKQLIISVMYDDNSAAALNPTKLWLGLTLPRPGDPAVSWQQQASLLDLVPSSRDYYTYVGSHSRPPCTLNVRRIVMAEAVSIAPGIVDELRAALNSSAFNATQLTGFDGNFRPLPQQPGSVEVRRFRDFVGDAMLLQQAGSDAMNSVAIDLSTSAVVLACCSVAIALVAWRVSLH